MTVEPVTLHQLLDVRDRLISQLKQRLDAPARRFLLTLHDGEPDFDAIGLPQAAQLPAVRWKVRNLQKLRTQNPNKHDQQRAQIEALFA